MAIRTSVGMYECSQDANFGLAGYTIEVKDLERIVRRVASVELSKRSLKTVTSNLENVAGATSVTARCRRHAGTGRGLMAEPQVATFGRIPSEWQSIPRHTGGARMNGAN
jgi:hypothetical protein